MGEIMAKEEEKTKKNEKFLPNTSIRVLLVESDDSTRQIIGALLRKCSYEVASVSDGLQAWELLKEKPHNIDLILTEIDLPLISGYALLTLIMEHGICKNIPIIMMSTYDSVSTVYKCMLRGAADFLVKPVRTNELKNLWQHVWRRQSMNRRGFGRPQDESDGEQKLEATGENNGACNNLMSSESCALRRDEGAKKGSDAQSSCGKTDIEAESGIIAQVEHRLQPIPTESTPFDAKTNEHNHRVNSGEDITKVGVLCESSREAMDLIGALHSYSKHNLYVNNDEANKFESVVPQLDLSLGTINCEVFGDTITNEKQVLNHSNGSAFTRYVNKPYLMSNQNASSVPTLTEDHSSDNASGSNTDTTKPPLPYERKVISLPINHTNESENGQQNASSSQRLFPIPSCARGVQVDACPTPSGHGSTNPPIIQAPSPSPSPSSTNQPLNFHHQFSVGVSGRHQYHPVDQTQHDTQFECSEERAQVQVSFTADQSVSSGLCGGFDYGSMGGNAGNVYQDADVAGGFENGNDLTPHRSKQREAVLNKFRLKRKERCYEKKVRYESRKKLAEQCPRVKGQFVRQVLPDLPP